MFLFAKKWRSSITINTMRVFTGEEELFRYAKDLLLSERDPKLQVNFYYAWELSDKIKPKLLRNFQYGLLDYAGL